MSVKGYTDLYDLPEDERINVIGNTVLNAPSSSTDKPMIMAFVVEDNEKADRYEKKLLAKFPTIRVIDRVPAPANCVAVRVSGPLR